MSAPARSPPDAMHLSSLLHPLRYGALLLAGLATACTSFEERAPDPLWRQALIEAPSESIVWKVTLLTLQTRGFPLTGDLDPGELEVTSGWKTHLQPFRGEGWRERAWVTIDPAGRGEWTVRAHVQRQVNMALVAPLDPTRAEWEWAPEDELQADILLQAIRSTLHAPAAGS